MLYEYFQAVGYKPTPEVAEYLYVAIMTDTGRFRYRSTSKRTMAIAGELIEAGADPQKTCEKVYYDLRPSTMKLIGRILNGIEYYDNNSICVLSMTLEMLKATGADYSESDGMVDYTLFSRDVKVGAFVKEMADGQVKVSLRSRDGINVAKIAAEFGGGGHFNAAGCTMQDDLDKVKTIIIEKLRNADGKEI